MFCFPLPGEWKNQGCNDFIREMGVKPLTLWGDHTQTCTQCPPHALSPYFPCENRNGWHTRKFIQTQNHKCKHTQKPLVFLFSFFFHCHCTIKKTSKIYLIILGHTRSQQTSTFVHARNYGCMFMPLFFFALAVQTAVFRKWSGPCCLILHFQRSALMTAEPPAWQPAVGSMHLSSLPLSETLQYYQVIWFVFCQDFFSVNTWCLVHSFFFFFFYLLGYKLVVPRVNPHGFDS